MATALIPGMEEFAPLLEAGSMAASGASSAAGLVGGGGSMAGNIGGVA